MKSTEDRIYKIMKEQLSIWFEYLEKADSRDERRYCMKQIAKLISSAMEEIEKK